VEMGELTVGALKERRIRLFLEGIGGDTGLTAAMADFEIAELGKGRHLMPGALEALERLSGRYKIAIASNGIADVQRERIWKGPLARFVDRAYVSEELGVAKPDAAFFAPAIRDYGLPLCMIGDNADSDIRGALGAGLDAIWLTQSGMEPPAGARRAASLEEVAEMLM